LLSKNFCKITDTCIWLNYVQYFLNERHREAVKAVGLKISITDFLKFFHNFGET
jgi:hypothetical protein